MYLFFFIFLDTHARAYYGKNRFKWAKDAPVVRRTPHHNIISHLPGLKGDLRVKCQNMLPHEIWNLFITKEMLQEILTHTNNKLSTIRSRYRDQTRPELQDLTITDLEAFFGLLYASSIFKSNHEDLSSLFATDGYGRDNFRATMSLKRMLVILTVLRFDDVTTRNDRKQEDPLAPISSIFNQFTENCQKNYAVGEYVCIDEMLVGFRGHCKFRMYMKSKPRKYGLKIQTLTDARTNYFCNGYVYTGKGSDGKTLSVEERRRFSIPTQSVLRLCKPIENTNRNITADNWFTSIELVQELRKRGLTYVGTIRKNKREIPPSFLPNKTREAGSSIYGFTKEISLVSFVPKKNRAVILVSSMHHSESTSNETGKPEIIDFYNCTKGGVDELDKKCANYNTSRRTRRWPMAIFYAVLDIASVNSYIVFQSCPTNASVSRFDFVKQLAKGLCNERLNQRLVNRFLPRELRLVISKVLQKPIPCPGEEEGPRERVSASKRKRCAFCPSKKDKKTSTNCVSCHKPVCTNCMVHMCQNCKANV